MHGSELLNQLLALGLILRARALILAREIGGLRALIARIRAGGYGSLSFFVTHRPKGGKGLTDYS